MYCNLGLLADKLVLASLFILVITSVWKKSFPLQNYQWSIFLLSFFRKQHNLQLTDSTMICLCSAYLVRKWKMTGDWRIAEAMCFLQEIILANSCCGNIWIQHPCWPAACRMGGTYSSIDGPNETIVSSWVDVHKSSAGPCYNSQMI